MTSYRIAADPADYKRAKEFAEKEGFSIDEMMFPTILATDRREGLIGIVGTQLQGSMIVAGPLVLKAGRRRTMTALRLVELYEMVMKHIGVTTFVFCTSEDSSLDRFMTAYGDTEPYATDGENKFFVRRLTNGR